MLSLRDVTVRFDRTTAIDSVSAEFHEGTSTAIIGPNGSGKTTLLDVLAGLNSPQSGRVDRGDCASKTAYVLQHRGGGRWLPLTVEEVIRMGVYAKRGLKGRLTAEDRERVVEAASRMEVEDILDAPYGELSGGQRQRVSVAQALVQGADILLLDEPLTGLDLASQQTILDVVTEEKRNGKTVVLSTHHLDEAQHADQVVLLATKAIAVGPPGSILTTDLLRAAYGDRVFAPADAEDVTVLDDHGHDH